MHHHVFGGNVDVDVDVEVGVDADVEVDFDASCCRRSCASSNSIKRS